MLATGRDAKEMFVYILVFTASARRAKENHERVGRVWASGNRHCEVRGS